MSSLAFNKYSIIHIKNEVNSIFKFTLSDKEKASRQGRAASPGTGLIQGFGAGPNKRQAERVDTHALLAGLQSGYHLASLAGFKKIAQMRTYDLSSPPEAVRTGHKGYDR